MTISESDWTSAVGIAAGASNPADILTPADRYHELFVAVQMQRVFADSKTFADCAPRYHPDEILENYRQQRDRADFDLKLFVEQHFQVFEVRPVDFVAVPSDTLAEHIDRLWPVLTRHPEEDPPWSSLLPLPHAYVVPGGRFTELYYWDSYFTMIGLQESGEHELVRNMADNFAHLIDAYGHVPNGNRTYYLSRSQPPFFALMVDLFEQEGIDSVDYLPQLRKEYNYWMDGADFLRPGDSHRRCICMPCGTVLNRYWDDRDTPREEAFMEDVETARHSERPAHEVYRDLRAGAESGWDFSSRWLADPGHLSSIRTTAILPVDLNCLLYYMERQIARLSRLRGHDSCVAEFDARATSRRRAIDRYLWCERRKCYYDYDWVLGASRQTLTAAIVTPLFVNIASPDQADHVAWMTRDFLLADGGLHTTLEQETEQQWDFPNGWAPMQWMAVCGFRNYGQVDLADEIEWRWLSCVSTLYQRESKLVEKYIVSAEGGLACGGEYPLQDGFGWSNGVTRHMLRELPRHTANRCRAGDCPVPGGNPSGSTDSNDLS